MFNRMATMGWACMMLVCIAAGAETTNLTDTGHPGLMPAEGETSAELNSRLLADFGVHPYGKAPAAEEAERIAWSREQGMERARIQARRVAVVKAERAASAEVLAFAGEFPSRRSLQLSRTIRNPQLVRDRLERLVREGRVRPQDVTDAENGVFDWRRRVPVYADRGGVYYASDSQLDKGDIRLLEKYQRYLRTERLYRAFASGGG